MKLLSWPLYVRQRRCFCRSVICWYAREAAGVVRALAGAEPPENPESVRGGGRGYKNGGPPFADLSPAFPSSAIISERSSPSRVRFAAPNNGAPLTAPGRSGQHS